MENTENQLILQGRILAEMNKNKSSLNINDYEFGVFSQWGEDGIIQFLINKIPIENEIFVEFGVEDYQEANTRFLLQKDNWRGLVIDGNDENINSIKSSELCWRYSLDAVSKFITKDNINELIKNAGISGDIGILSIDVDGNDYWILEAINCVRPRIIIVEYNSLFGDSVNVSVPYDENFNRTKKHYSNLYFGASISALTELAKMKGYVLVGSNSAGCNLFFIRMDLAGDLKIMEHAAAYVKSKFRQSRDEKGNLTYLNHEDGLRLIKDMELIETVTGRKDKVGNFKII